ncbi:MAG: hypothetical protein NTV17_14025 [Burkholderiales bacterium]|nr:hypothetical protein [Burkholderiales bacterium]
MSPNRTSLHLAVVLCLLMGHGEAARAQSIDRAAQGDSVLIDAEALSGSRGRIALNAAAGLNNQQANAASVAIGTHSATYTSVGQSAPDSTLRSSSVDNQAWILNGVMGAAHGLLSINQASGDQNRQSNTMRVEIADMAVSSDDVLAATVSGQPAAPRPAVNPTGRREVGIAEGAFNGANGIVQINQAAGMQNVTANTVQLRATGL